MDMVVSVEDFLFIEGYHGFIYEFYNIPEGITKEDLLYSVFLKAHLIHLVFILVAIRFQTKRLGKGIMQFLVAAFFTFTGLMFPISLVMSGGKYVAGAFSGTFLVLPFFAFFASVLLKRKIMRVRDLVVWLAIASILTYFILSSLVT